MNCFFSANLVGECWINQGVTKVTEFLSLCVDVGVCLSMLTYFCISISLFESQCLSLWLSWFLCLSSTLCLIPCVCVFVSICEIMGVEDSERVSLSLYVCGCVGLSVSVCFMCLCVCVYVWVCEVSVWLRGGRYKLSLGFVEKIHRSLCFR